MNENSPHVQTRRKACVSLKYAGAHMPAHMHKHTKSIQSHIMVMVSQWYDMKGEGNGE